MNQVKDKVVEVLAAMAGLPADQVTPETTFESLALDSLDIVEMTLILEQEVGIQIEPENFREITTVQDAIEIIEATTALAA